ncbi:MAG: hypothetical protein ACREVX_03265 [Clostridium sp.]|uniref:hypothetical protein n=1 Tax=Clostridium sp. TaxID=1506 RepID=UPI003D6D33B2
MSLEEKFIKYKDITLTIIQTVKVEEYEKMDKIFAQRQIILDDINKENYLKEELGEFYTKYAIEDLEKELDFDMKTRKAQILKKIKVNENKQMGMAGYNNISAKAVFLSKKV